MALGERALGPARLGDLRLLDLRAAASLLGVSACTLWRLRHAGRIKTVQVGRSVRISVGELRRIAEGGARVAQ